MKIEGPKVSRVPARFDRSWVQRLLVLAVAVGLAGPCAAQVVVLTVGPHGSYPTIQGALANTVSSWENDVRIESGSYVENVAIEFPAVSLSSGDVYLSGGWNATFTAQTADPSVTVIDGNSNGSCLRVSPTPSGTIKVFVSNLTLTNGLAELGGGVYFNTTGNVWLEVTNTAVTNNRAERPSNPAAGGGLYALISGSANRIAVSDSIFTGNATVPIAGASQARGGGAFVDISGASPVDFRRVTFTGNIVNASGGEDGAGLYLIIGSSAVGWVYDCGFVGNQAQATTGGPGVFGTGLFVYGYNDAYIRMRRLTLRDNIAYTGTGQQLFLAGYGTTSLRAGEILATGGDRGATIYGDNSAEVFVTNLTAADNTAGGLFVWNAASTASMSIANTLLYGNGVDLDITGPVAAINNLVGVNPLFIDAAAGNYHLGTGSPAENVGTNSPPAGVGDADCDGGVRVIDSVIDIGAYEGVDVLFSDAFELGTRRWSDVVGG